MLGNLFHHLARGQRDERSLPERGREQNDEDKSILCLVEEIPEGMWSGPGPRIEAEVPGVSLYLVRSNG